MDVDGVIINTEEANAVAGMQMFEELYGLEVKLEDFVPFVGTGSARCVQGVAEKYGIDIDVKKATKRREENFINNLNELRLFPGVKDFIKEVKQAGLMIAIATSSDRSKFQASSKQVGLLEKEFDLIVTGDKVKQTKPHPEIYLATVRELGLKSSNCLVIEDAITGVEAANRAGIFCVAITNTFSLDALSKADLIISSLNQLGIERIRKICN
jgi:HAD superfamily hydrolase (TIGR01509 family)